MVRSDHNKFVFQLDWNLLRTFLVIVEENSISRAAARLMRGQPAVSLALQRLEQEMGCKLIERGKGSFRLTAAGRRLFEECDGIFSDVSRLRDVTMRASQNVSGNVTISLASHVITPILNDMLRVMHQTYPDITFEIKTATSHQVARSVLDRDASFGICLVNQRVHELEYTLFYREFFGFFCGKPHRLYGQTGLSISDIQYCDTVSFETDDLNDALRPIALLREKWGLVHRTVGKSSQLEEVRRMIECGLGIGALPLHVVERELRDGSLWRLPPYQDPPAIDIFLTRHPKKRMNRAEKACLDYLFQAVQDIPLAERTYHGSTE